jgi:hypothetical protein
VLLGVLAAALLFAHGQLGQLKQRFFFIDYEHWQHVVTECMLLALRSQHGCGKPDT